MISRNISALRSRRKVLPLAVMGMLATLVTHAQSPEEMVQRFATEGRTALTGIRLACGRSATATVAALCMLTEQARQQQPGGQMGYFAAPNPIPSPRLPQVLEVIRIPLAERGSITLNFQTNDPMIRESVIRAATFLTGVVAKNRLPKSQIRVLALPTAEPRAYASREWGRSCIHLRPGAFDVDTAVHEIAHHLETDHRFVLAAAKSFLKRRGRGEGPFSLRYLTGQAAYQEHEITIRANWATRGGVHYTGKFYGPSIESATATEVISTGLERLYREPAAFFESDADYFLFLLLTLQTKM